MYVWCIVTETHKLVIPQRPLAINNNSLISALFFLSLKVNGHIQLTMLISVLPSRHAPVSSATSHWYISDNSSHKLRIFPVSTDEYSHLSSPLPVTVLTYRGMARLSWLTASYRAVTFPIYAVLVITFWIDYYY